MLGTLRVLLGVYDLYRRRRGRPRPDGLVSNSLAWVCCGCPRPLTHRDSLHTYLIRVEEKTHLLHPPPKKRKGLSCRCGLQDVPAGGRRSECLPLRLGTRL